MSKTALVTGASSEIGRSIVRRLVESGVNCAITARRPELLDEVVSAHADAEAAVLALPADLTAQSDREMLVERTTSELGGVDIFVHVAAGSAIKPILDFPDEDWQADFAVNVDAAFALAKLVAPGMRDRGWGRIITIGSVFASLSANPYFYEGRWAADEGRGPGRNAAYMPSKGALKMMSRDLAAVFGPWGVTVNMVSPGMISISDRPIEDDRRAVYEKFTPVGRMGRADDISNAVMFLASEESSFVNGIDLTVDGGWSIW
jgi:NAD(P)-dependent dehydrogenase (short-subunit alcohol dehydrogenase family)